MLSSLNLLVNFIITEKYPIVKPLKAHKNGLCRSIARNTYILTNNATKIPASTTAVHSILYTKCFSLNTTHPTVTVIITADCLMTVISVTSLSGLAFASKRSLSPIISDKLIRGIQKFVFTLLIDIFSLRISIITP